VEVTELAKSVLFSDTLAGKLSTAEHFTDRHPQSSVPLPSLPARPPGLALDDKRPRKRFPGLSGDGDPIKKGQVLHHFANHELLAIELMALFLLRFPDAPKRLRSDVAATIGEEQQHLALYQGRMNDFGVRLGDVPVSRFFWDCLAPMDSPLEYLAGMSLTLEQANLDFSRHYTKRFTDIGDDITASLLQTVYEDEIGHVKLGAHWFEKLRSPPDTRSLWARYISELRMPLTPARAIGIGFDRRARQAAGLDDEFIEALQAYSHSKGRSPDLYLFNPGAEIHLAVGRTTKLPDALTGLTRDLETLPMYLGGRDDTLVVQRPPRPGFLASLRKAGFVVPAFLTPKQLGGVEAVRELRPWAWSPDSESLLAPLLTRRPDLAPPPLTAPCFSKIWSLDIAHQWNETTPKAWSTKEHALGRHCRTLDEVKSEVARRRSEEERVVIKAPLGSAGRGMVRIFTSSDEAPAWAWTSRVLSQQGGVVVEPWLERVMDLSAQIAVGSDGRTRLLGITRFLTDQRGQYRGTLLGDPLWDLNQETKKTVIGPGKGWAFFEHLEQCAQWVGNKLYEVGHRGPAGIDALVYRARNGGYQLKPIVEVNPRYTMGHIALRIQRTIGDRGGRWFRLVSRASAAHAGAKSLKAYAETLPETALCLTDPERAEFVLATLEPLPASSQRPPS
jgi:uncharacterized ferritin-like protein (DUF455 family)